MPPLNNAKNSINTTAFNERNMINFLFLISDDHLMCETDVTASNSLSQNFLFLMYMYQS